MEKEQKQPSLFDLAVKHMSERYAWYADRSVDMMPYSEVHKMICSIVDELNDAHTQTIAAIYTDCAIMTLQNIAYTHHIAEAFDEASTTIDLLTEHLKAANSTIKFEKRTRLELPRDAHGNRIYPDSKIEGWGALEDFWYSNGYWQVRGHDMSAPWIPADKVVVCTDDTNSDGDSEDSDDEPQEPSAKATPEAKQSHRCRSRSEADSAIKAFCLGNISVLDILDLLYSFDDDESREA